MEQKDFETIQRYLKRKDNRMKIKRYHDRKNDRLSQKSLGKVLTDDAKNVIMNENVDDWEESDHPRAKNGQFTSGSGSSSGKATKNKGEEKSHEKENEQKTLASIKVKFVDAKEFADRVVEAKASGNPRGVWRVTAHTESELKEWYPDAKMYVGEGGGTYAINNGDIIGLCKKKGGENGWRLLKDAVEHGGNRLGSYSGNHEFYMLNGFEPVSWCKWEDKYAPDDWDEKLDKREDIIFYKYTGIASFESLDDFCNRVKPSKDYDEAQQMRDKEIK